MAKSYKAQTLSPSTTVTASLSNLNNEPWQWVDIYVETANIRWSDVEGETLSTTVGTPLGAGTMLRYEGNFNKFKCIAQSGSPVVTCKPGAY